MLTLIMAVIDAKNPNFRPDGLYFATFFLDALIVNGLLAVFT